MGQVKGKKGVHPKTDGICLIFGVVVTEISLAAQLQQIVELNDIEIYKVSNCWRQLDKLMVVHFRRTDIMSVLP